MLMRELNSKHHRIESASAVFQKGVYHLFCLNNREEIDEYSTVIRKYQSLFQLCLAHYLLDFQAPIECKNLRNNLKKLCTDPTTPKSSELDPAAIVNHSLFENGKWNGNSADFPLIESCTTALSLIKKAVDARHNLIYRPFMLNKDVMHWEDCSLMDLLKDVPTVPEIYEAYESFVICILAHQQSELSARAELSGKIREKLSGAQTVPGTTDTQWADYFIRLQFWPFADRLSVRPTETILLTYARMLNPDNDKLLTELLTFRNQLLRLEGISQFMTFESNWKVGEL